MPLFSAKHTHTHTARTYPTRRNVHTSLQVVRRVEVATGIAAAATLDEVNAGRHHVVGTHGHVGRRMRKAALLFLASARSTQKLATDLPQSTPAVIVPCINMSSRHCFYYTLLLYDQPSPLELPNVRPGAKMGAQTVITAADFYRPVATAAI